MIAVPEQFTPRINCVYPPNNIEEFEYWFYKSYDGDQTDREYLPILFCAYQVNNSYGEDYAAMKALQDYVDTLPSDKKYFCVSQYDNGVGVDWKGKDVLEFNMSKTGENKYPLPLIGQPHPYKFNSEKKYLANFVGNITHDIRNHAKTLQGMDGYYISFERHDPYEYCKIISESVFTLCYRGYGINSFRIAEALQYDSTPIYISDEFVEIHNVSFDLFGHTFTDKSLDRISICLPYFSSVFTKEIRPKIYQEYFTYEGTKYKILKHLQTIK
jgi:hypothetical protein